MAYSFVATFPAEPVRELCVDRHYLLYACAGALRLEDDGRTWLLPPARAALIEAGRSIRVSIPRQATTASMLFAPGFVPSPTAALTLFDLDPLARCLVAECSQWGVDDGPLNPYAETLFAALAAVTWRLAQVPCALAVPVGRSVELRKALRLTEERLGSDVRLDDIATEVGLASRSLARRFADEVGMTWRAVLRRLRVLRAVEELAAGDAPVTTIALTVGYTSLSAFNAAFLDLTGRTPSDYRSSFRPGPFPSGPRA